MRIAPMRLIMMILLHISMVLLIIMFGFSPIGFILALFIEALCIVMGRAECCWSTPWYLWALGLYVEEDACFYDEEIDRCG